MGLSPFVGKADRRTAYRLLFLMSLAGWFEFHGLATWLDGSDLRQIDQTSALVLRAVNFSETSRVVTLYTKDLGKISAMAKGGRRMKSAFDLSLDVLSVCRICVIRKPTAELDLLTEARLEQRFAGLQRDLQSLYSGYFIAEMLDGLTPLHDPHPAMFDDATEALAELSAGGDPWRALCRYSARLLVELGYGPRLDACCVCEAPGPMGDSTAYSPLLGGVVCDDCRSQRVGWFTVPRSAVLLLREMTYGERGEDPPHLAERDEDPPPGSPVRSAVWRMVVGHLHQYLGRPSRLVPLLRFE